MEIEETAETWAYDGSFYGFLTVIYHAFKKRKFPEVIVTPQTAIESLFTNYWVETDENLAKKMQERLIKRLKAENVQFIIDGFYCSLKDKERCLLDAVKLSLTTNDLLTDHLGHPAILALKKSLNSLFGEVHILTGFVRFEYAGKFLYSTITPKHFSLPYLCPHFAQRYPQETIAIYDETHRLLGVIEKGHIEFIENSEPPMFDTDETEQEIQENWRLFLQAVTIKERKNERTQLSHLPKRYRSRMVDFQ